MDREELFKKGINPTILDLVKRVESVEFMIEKLIDSGVELEKTVRDMKDKSNGGKE